MSNITSPILLDETGREINQSILAIAEAVGASSNSIINDTTVSDTKVWSSVKITNDFTLPATIEGTTLEIKDCVAGTPLLVETTTTRATTLTILHNGQEYVTEVPGAGTYNWNTGFFSYNNGDFVKLAAHNIVALPNINTLSINEATLKVIYRTLPTGFSTYDLINGGSAEGV